MPFAAIKATRWWQFLTAQPVIWLFLITIAVVALLNPMKIGLAIWGISKLALFAWVGRWIFRQLFRSIRADDPGVVEGTLWKIECAIVCASIIAGALLP